MSFCVYVSYTYLRLHQPWINDHYRRLVGNGRFFTLLPNPVVISMGTATTRCLDGRFLPSGFRLRGPGSSRVQQRSRSMPLPCPRLRCRLRLHQELPQSLYPKDKSNFCENSGHSTLYDVRRKAPVYWQQLAPYSKYMLTLSSLPTFLVIRHSVQIPPQLYRRNGEQKPTASAPVSLKSPSSARGV